jgi:very-short-patch-repair endonuclease
MTGIVDDQPRKLTTGLIDFLVEVTEAAVRDPILDVLSDRPDVPELVLWLDELPDLFPSSRPVTADVLVRMLPPSLTPEPALPPELSGWVDSGQPRDANGPPPRLRGVGPVVGQERLDVIGQEVDRAQFEASPPTQDVVQAFDRWRAAWLAWADERRRSDRARRIYEDLEEAAKRIEQRDDEYEFVLAFGLVRWVGPDGRVIRRHLVTEQILPTIDRTTAGVVVSRPGAKRRLEDRELFGGLAGYHPERGRSARMSLLEGGWLTNEQWLGSIGEWLGPCLDSGFVFEPAGTHAAEPRSALSVSMSPALLLRPRSKVLLSEAYKQIARELREPDAPVPVALAQLVIDTERDQRRVWIEEQGGAAGDFLGEDPLFPLEANSEQQRVMQLLRTETAVVVQGPPGTGKTHTIANLVSALLARGQRVLVTSQKDQALRVLRDKIPGELRQLCVLLTGGNKDATQELQRGLDALSETIATNDVEALRGTIDALTGERIRLRSRSVTLNDEIRRLREVEHVRHDAVVPGFSHDVYRGTLSEIVRDVKAHAAHHDWFPPSAADLPDQPPLPEADLVDLRRLILRDSPARRARVGQWVPGVDALPAAAGFAHLTLVESQARESADSQGNARSRALVPVGPDSLAEMGQLGTHLTTLLGQLGFAADGSPATAEDWVMRAFDQQLANRGIGLWQTLLAIRDEPARLQEQLRTQGVEYVVEFDSITVEDLGTARGWLDAGRKLAAHLHAGNKLKGRFPSRVQKDAESFLSAVRVNGQAPRSAVHMSAAVERLEAEVAVHQLVAAWADAGVEVPGGRTAAMLSDLADKSSLLTAVNSLVGVRARVVGLLLEAGVVTTVTTLPQLVHLLGAAPAALQHLEFERARNEVEGLYREVHGHGARPEACPEIAALLQAVNDRDIDAYQRGLDALAGAAAERADAIRLGELARRLRAVHPALFDLLESTVDERAWEHRLGQLPAAWAWSAAQRYVERWRNADRERELLAEFTAVEDQVKRVTAQVAGNEAMLACLERMTDNHARALRSYREHMSHVGAGQGKKAREFKAAARAAMEKAKGAVPAWVVPLPNLLDNLAVERNSFDVVIVDEASQVGLEQLFLLWLAPRVIVVGDDKQCTPGDARLGRLDPVFDSLKLHLADADPEIRMNFTPKSNLYGLLSARSGKDAVVRLREHFRCMPEIINWSSSQFYGEEGRPGLVALRERTGADLEPLQVVTVTGAFIEGAGPRLRNPVEAKCIAEQLARCIGDPRYRGKSFGIVVLQGRGQIKLLEHEINARISPEDRQERKIRVGIPADFQGDERNVIFLSMVVADQPRAQSAPMFQQSYNVAASRAKDQMWLFTSLRPDQLKPEDLRSSLLRYMTNPPSVFGSSPSFDEVSSTEPCQPFDSLFEQHVFREIRGRGYHVVPQYKVGSLSLDLVVVGAGGRLAVECDGHYWHTSPDQTASDARRDRDLRRMGWQLIRIRESEWAFDPEREMGPLWTALETRGIHAEGAPTGGPSDEWKPLKLHGVDDALPDEGFLFEESLVSEP